MTQTKNEFSPGSAPKRAVIYLRVSTPRQVNRAEDHEGHALSAQREACHRKARSLGAEIVDEYIDKLLA